MTFTIQTQYTLQMSMYVDSLLMAESQPKHVGV